MNIAGYFLVLVSILLTLTLFTSISHVFYVRKLRETIFLVPSEELNEEGDKIYRTFRCQGNHPRVAVLMWWTPSIDAYAKITWKINCIESQRHGFDVVQSNKSRDKRSYSWQRVMMLRRYLRDYNYVVWCDADASLNPDRISSLVNFFNFHNFPSIILSDDLDVSWNYEMLNTTLSVEEKTKCNLNAGIVIVKNCQEGSRFLERWHESVHANDQTALRMLYHDHITKPTKSLGSVVKIPYGTLQSYPCYPDVRLSWDRRKRYKPFFYHLPGTSLQARVDFFEKLLKA
jgi:hypothetical protein